MTRGPKVGQTIGVLALQGAFAAHQLVFESLGQKTMQVRNVVDLGMVDALVFPGCESTTMSHLLRTSEMFEPIRSRLSEGMPAFGTCAGMIMLSTSVIDGSKISNRLVRSISTFNAMPTAVKWIVLKQTSTLTAWIRHSMPRSFVRRKWCAAVLV